MDYSARHAETFGAINFLAYLFMIGLVIGIVLFGFTLSRIVYKVAATSSAGKNEPKLPKFACWFVLTAILPLAILGPLWLNSYLTAGHELMGEKVSATLDRGAQSLPEYRTFQTKLQSMEPVRSMTVREYRFWRDNLSNQ